MKRGLLTLAIAMLLTAGASRAGACPMCKDSISDTAQSGSIDGRGMQDGLPSGFNTSVYLMLTAFLGTTALIGFVVTRGILSANAASAQRGFPIQSSNHTTRPKTMPS